jgi:hypothetical protein
MAMTSRKPFPSLLTQLFQSPVQSSLHLSTRLKDLTMLLVLFLSFAIATAANIAPAIRLGERAPYAGGGWALLINDNSGNCPAGTIELDAGMAFGGGPHLCCPNGFEQQGSGGINGITCCPDGKLIVLKSKLNFNANY